MSSVIEVGFSFEWEDPVLVRAGTFDDRPIKGPREALRFLQCEFSVQSGQAYWSAITACNAALRDFEHVHRSRENFIAAYAVYKETLELLNNIPFSVSLNSSVDPDR